MTNLRSISLFALALAACTTEEGVPDEPDVITDPVQDDWVRGPTRCHFSFRAPSDLVEEPSEGTDSCVVHYVGNGCRFVGDYGPFSDPLDSYSESAGYAEEAAVIDEREAVLVSFVTDGDDPQPYFVGVHFPEVLGDDSGMKLTFAASCSSEAEQAEARRILQTIAFEE